MQRIAAAHAIDATQRDAIDAPQQNVRLREHNKSSRLF